MAEDELSAYSAPSHGMPESCNKSSFSAFTMLLYLVFSGRCLDLAYGLSGVWALGPKPQFQSGSELRLAEALVEEFLQSPHKVGGTHPSPCGGALVALGRGSLCLRWR
jgi:hypothetical protein